MKKHLVLAGGGHAHMLTLANLQHIVARGHAVTVIGPSDHHYYSGMGPGMLGATYAPEEIRFATRRVVEKKGGTFVLGKVARIDPGAQVVHLEGGGRVPYDVLSCNLGSQVSDGILPGTLEDIYPVKPIERLLEARARIRELGSRKRISVGIVGGGPSAVEIAGNLWRLTQCKGIQAADIRILTANTLMPRHSEGIRARARASLAKRAVDIVEHCAVDRIRTGRVSEASGRVHEFDVIFVATGVKPTPVFGLSGIPTGPDGGMRVNRCLQSTAFGNIFGGGDCVYFQEHPLDKVGVYAVRQNPVIYRNLTAALEGRRPEPFEPGGDYLLIFNLGDGSGIFQKRGVLFGGRLAFKLKDLIDRRFMRAYQAAE